MKLANGVVMNAQEALGKMLNTSLPVRQAYKISKTIDAVKHQYEFINEQRNELIKKYGAEKDGNYEIPKDDTEAMNHFFSDYQELMILEEDIDVRTLNLDDLDQVELTVNELEAIKFMIEEV